MQNIRKIKKAAIEKSQLSQENSDMQSHNYLKNHGIKCEGSAVTGNSSYILI